MRELLAARRGIHGNPNHKVPRPQTGSPSSSATARIGVSMTLTAPDRNISSNGPRTLVSRSQISTASAAAPPQLRRIGPHASLDRWGALLGRDDEVRAKRSREPRPYPRSAGRSMAKRRMRPQSLDFVTHAFRAGSRSDRFEVDGKTYQHDLVVDRGRVRKRPKRPSKPFRPQGGSARSRLSAGAPTRSFVGTVRRPRSPMKSGP